MDIGSNTVSCLNRRKNTKSIKKSKNTVDNHRNLWYKYSCDAEVAELADAQASGACGSNIVWVQVPSSALFFIYGKSFNKTSHFSFIYQNMFEKSFLQSAYYLHQSMPEKRLSARYASHLQQVCLNEGNITGSLMIQKTSDICISSM